MTHETETATPTIHFWTPRRQASFTGGLILLFLASIAFQLLHHA